MPAEHMGRLPLRLRYIFAVSSIVFLATLAISPVKDLQREWKHYKRGYVRLAEQRPDTKRLLADVHPDIDQIWLPEMNVVDRCTTCHQGMTQPSLDDASVQQPFRAHPPVPHSVTEWGCVICHRGQGPATEVAEAHETTLAWEQPLLSVKFIQGSCGSCHQGDLSQTPKLNRGRQLLAEFNCIGCHRLEGIERPVMLGPDLTRIGSKTSREWIYKWLKEPRTITDANGTVTVNGYETEEAPRMPQFKLKEEELRALSAYLSSLRGQPVPPYSFNPRVVAASAKNPDAVTQGEVRFRQMFCSTCHPLAVTRAGETKLIGGDIGPELTKVGSKVNRDWLVAWLRDPQAYLPHSKMPRYEWSDEDLFRVTRYITEQLTDSDLLKDVNALPAPAPDEIRKGRQLFLEKGCASCHHIDGVSPQKDFGPELSALGAKNVSQLEFSQSRIPRTLLAYIQAKITDPSSVNTAARMPQYHLTADDLEAVTIALLAMTGPPASPGLRRLVVERQEPVFRPSGAFGKVYERYKCYVCHKFNGFGGDLAPDLSYEGSRARRAWIADFLKNPQTLRPTLVLRMPQFNMTSQEANILADYLSMALQHPSVDLEADDAPKFTPQMAALGKELYEVKYQCQACHTIGSSGGYVGPNLSNAGNWLTPAWTEAWLRNPQALVPGAIEPRRSFTEEEVRALAAYIQTLRQSAKPAAGAASHGAGQ
ncbi:MAG TPA: c-type cytochrome [Candidatus Acidoferrales bacterium]|nr:c-type cytochrome [Candidatus Acidoferrales bacterium]